MWEGLLSIKSHRRLFSRPISLIHQIPTHWHQTALILGFYLLLATALIAPIASDTYIPNMADFLNHFAVTVQARIALLHGQFPLRVAPLEHNGWGYPFYQFYSSTTYFITGLIYDWLTPANPLIAIKITIIGSLTLGAIYIYRLANWLVGLTIPALLAGMVYLYAPYHIIVVDYLGSLNEIVGLGLLPVAIYYSLQLFYYPHREKTLLLLGITWYLIITTHIVTFVYASFFIAILLSVIAIKNRRHWKSLVSVGIAYCFGCLLAMWYLAPVMQLANYFLVGQTYSTSNNLMAYHPLLSQLLFSDAAKTSGYHDSALMTIHPAIGWPILISVLLCCMLLMKKQSSGNRRADYWMKSLLLIFFMAFIMVWSPVNFWQWLPQPLLVAQHSWRLLAHVIWAGALLFAIALSWLFQRQLDHRHLILGAILIAVCANPWFPMSENYPGSLQDTIKNPKLIYNNNSYLLNFNKFPNLVEAIDSIVIESSASLKLGIPYSVAQSLLQIANAPQILVEGTIPDKLGMQQYQIVAESNGKVLSTHDLKSGPLHWEFPISVLNQSDGKEPYHPLIFTVKKDKTTYPYLNIPITHVLITGFLKAEETMTVDQVAKQCYRSGASKICHLNVPAAVTRIELPALYYPNMITITDNNQPMNYQSVTYQGKLITSIVPMTGKNNITIQFTGLAWANHMSWGAWCLWMILFVKVTVFGKREIKRR